MPPAKQPKPAVSSSTPRTPAPRNKAAQTPKTAPTLSPKQVFAQVQAHCLGKPGAVEDYPWGDVVWKIGGKLFAGSSQDSAAVTVKASLEDQAVLVQHPAISIAKYVGRFGWVTIEIGDRDTLDLARKLIDDSFASLATSPRAADAKRSRTAAANAPIDQAPPLPKMRKPAVTSSGGR